MKTVKYILTGLCLLSLSSCGTTDPWKDWMDEGNMDESTRLRPSEVKKVLCSKDGWKMNYGGVDFYIQFFTDGTCKTNSDETILRPEVETNYHLDYDGPAKVILTLEGNSSLQYLEDNVESVLVITDYTESTITAAGLNHDKPMILAPTTVQEIEKNEKTKESILAKVRALESFGSAAVSTADGDFLAYFTLSADNNNNWSINVLDLVNGTPAYTSHPLTLNVEDDTYGIADAGDLEIKGVKLGAIKYSYDGTSAPSLTSDQVKFGGETASRWVSQYGDGWKTHKIDMASSCAEFAEISGAKSCQIEMDDRSPRNIVFCPPSDNYWWYVFFELNVSADDSKNIVKFNNTAKNLPFGGYGDDVAHCEEYYKPLINTLFSSKGLWILDESEGVYFIEAGGKTWFKVVP